MNNDLAEIYKHFHVYDKDTGSLIVFNIRHAWAGDTIIISFQESQKTEFEAYKKILSVSD